MNVESPGDGATPDTPVALITGASRGIGLAIAKGLASRGWQLVLASRDAQRLQQACEVLDRMASGCLRSRHALDLAEPDQVKSLSCALLEAQTPLRAIVHNAGVMCMERQLTTHGLERTWATNVVAPHLLTQLLQPLLPASDGGRVIFMSSLVRRWGSLNLDDPGLSTGYTADRAYSQSKLAVVLLAQAWAAREPGWLSLSMEPGMTDTDFGSEYRGFRGLMRTLYRPFMATPEQAADTAVWLASAPACSMVPGGHYRRRTRVLPDRGAADARLLHALVKRLELDGS